MTYLPQIAKAVAAYVVSAIILGLHTVGVEGVDSDTPLIEVVTNIVEILLSSLVVAFSVWYVPNKKEGE